jgi:hypothetical protein
MSAVSPSIPNKLWFISAALGLAFGCRAAESTQPGPKQTTAATTPPSVSSPAATATAPAPSASDAGLPAAPLPKLKPILAKPFPDGADEATVCEAIDSKEPDLWVRFGHIVPAYIEGSVYILETGPENKEKLFRFISHDYVYGYYSQQASCRGNLTLLYIRLMFEKSEYKGKPFGREHLSQAIEKKLGIKTRESYQLRYADTTRLSAYCRADAELCDELVKLDRGNMGTGLCSAAVSRCSVRGHGSDEKLLLEKCKSAPRTEIACVEFGQRPAREVDECDERIFSAICPERTTP